VPHHHRRFYDRRDAKGFGKLVARNSKGDAALKVFISWSGPVSGEVAVALRDWLPSVLQSVEPYVSSEDIDKGARWTSDISRELEDSSFGILCVTEANLEAPWVNFEAGALSKSLERSRVAPFLFGVSRTAVQGPFLQFQSTINEKEDVRKLVRSLNDAAGEQAMEENRVDEIFEVWWPRLEEKLGAIDATPATKPAERRSTEDMVSEVLELARVQQSVLHNPEQLLPPEYLNFAIGRDRARVEPQVIMDLHDGWQRLEYAVYGGPPDSEAIPEDVIAAVARLGGPITYLLREFRPAAGRRRRPQGEFRAPSDRVE